MVTTSRPPKRTDTLYLRTRKRRSLRIERRTPSFNKEQIRTEVIACALGQVETVPAKSDVQVPTKPVFPNSGFRPAVEKRRGLTRPIAYLLMPKG